VYRSVAIRIIHTLNSVRLAGMIIDEKSNLGPITTNHGIMLSQSPIDLQKVKKEDLDKEILRLGIIAELDAVSLYEQLAAMTESANIKKVLLEIAKEEKTHVGEFQALLLGLDKEQVGELEKGKKEVQELTE